MVVKDGNNNEGLTICGTFVYLRLKTNAIVLYSSGNYISGKTKQAE